MGCCLSSSGEQHHCSDGGAVEVEEAVKEVLQETSFNTRELNAGKFNCQKGPEKQELMVDGPPMNVSIQTTPRKLYTQDTVSDDNENYRNEKNGGEVNQRRPLRIRGQPIGDKRRVPPRTPVSPEKTSQFRASRGGQLRNEGSVQRSRPPMTRCGRGTRRSLSGDSENSGWSHGVVLGEEPETLENPVVSLECFIFL